MPSRIFLAKDVVSVPATTTGGCRPNGYAFWTTDGEVNYGIYGIDGEGDPPPTARVPDLLDHYNRTVWEPNVAVTDALCNDRPGSDRPCVRVSQNSPVSDIRLGTWAGLTGARSGSSVTLTATSAVWSAGANRLVNRSMRGEIQTQYADGTWRRVGVPITTGSTGKQTVTYTIPATRAFRFGVYSTRDSWDRVSAPVTR